MSRLLPRLNDSLSRRLHHWLLTITSLAPDDRYDFVLVVVQRTQIEAVLPLLASNQSSSFVFMVNTAAGYQAYVDVVGAERVMNTASPRRW